MLADGRSVTALDVGYENTSAFTERYRCAFGTTPARYILRNAINHSTSMQAGKRKIP